MSEKYDFKQISGSSIMSKKDIKYFKKFGNSLADQMEVVARESNLDSQTMEDFEELINNINNLTEDNEKYYIVEGAQLACSAQINEEQTLICKNGEITSIPKMNVENEKGGTESLSQLRIPEDRAATYSIRKPAVVTDAKGGIRDEIHKKLWEKENEEGLNIISFGNCPYIPDSLELGDIAKELYNSTPALKRSASIIEIEEKMAETIEQGYGTCYCCMNLESEWENLPTGFYLDEGKFKYVRTNKESEQLSDRVEAINMMSMIFCKRGGIITPLHSGQIIDKGIEDIFTDVEKKLKEKFPQTFDYDNWSEGQKSCARVLWERLYADGKGDFDAYFVAGMIGNMFGEAVCGQLQYEDDGVWEQYDNTCHSGMIITNLTQAYAACFNASDNMGIGMFQFSNYDVKKILYGNYSEQFNEYGTLGIEQLINAEVKTIQEELNGKKEYVYSDYQEAAQDANNVGDVITFSTAVFFREYEVGSGYRKVDADTYLIDPSVWDEAEAAEIIEKVPSICQRVIAAKVVFEEFTKVEEDDIK
ncbi:MAG: phage tail tip lysozyme [Clostridium sp.]|nr:phage tail tip lysozyme [Clostridium sp.]